MTERVGEMVRSASENRAALNRERNRWLALKSDVAEYARAGDAAVLADTGWTSFRADFYRDFYAFNAFFRDNIDNIMGDVWPVSDLQAEIDEWAAVLNRYREVYRELTGREVSPAARRSGRSRRELGPSAGFGVGTALVVLGGLGVAALYLTRSGE